MAIGFIIIINKMLMVKLIKLKTWINLIIFINTLDSVTFLKFSVNMSREIQLNWCSLNLVPSTCLLVEPPSWLFVEPPTCLLVEPHRAWYRASARLTLVKVHPSLQHGQPSHNSLYSLGDYLSKWKVSNVLLLWKYFYRSWQLYRY